MGAIGGGAHSGHSAPAEVASAADVQTVRIVADRIVANIDRVIDGKHDIIQPAS